MEFETHCMSFPCTELLLFNYAKINSIFHSRAPLKSSVANKLLKGTTSFGGDFRRHHNKQDIWTAFLMKKWISIHTQCRS